jgi:hypothetical protein
MRGFLLHTMGVGTMWGSWNYHNQPGMPYTHLYYDGVGNRLQVQELELRAAGQLELNPYFISAETEDFGKWFPNAGTTCGKIAPWRDEQLDVLAKDIAFCYMRFKFPLRLMTDACQSGIGWHRLGIPGGPEYKSSCPKTSNATGKCCPDNARIQQIKFELFPEVVRLVNGGSVDMDLSDHKAIQDATRRIMREVLNEGTGFGTSSWAQTSKAVLSKINSLSNKLSTVSNKVSAVSVKVDALDVFDQNDVTELAVALVDALPEQQAHEVAAEVIRQLQEKLA